MNENIHPLAVPCYDLIQRVLDVEQFQPLAFDIGANEGGMMPMFINKCGHVVGFEPVPDVFEKLRQRYAGNPKVTVHQLALSDQIETLTVNVCRAWTLRLAAEATPQERALAYKDQPDFEIHTTTLDREIVGRPPTVIKLDVDGYEPKVIRGGWHFLSSQHPPMMLELGPLSALVGEPDYTAPLSLLYTLGYQVFSMDGKYYCPTLEQALRYFPHHTTYDVVMLHKTDSQQVPQLAAQPI